MEGCGPADFYEDYKELYIKTTELNKEIREAVQLCVDISEGYLCLCGGEDCKYRSFEEAQLTLESLIYERGRVIRILESMAIKFKVALAVEHTERELELLMQAKA